ncbi:hypothetical protein EG359_18445 [Chryseobacterium joostei]|uniref:DUF4595 domain-containing protein n=1 Tax=Chryseobacterium joostei TaxID=112234 RepID=A0A1N7IYZ4_9FLAO|nr:hypothetical protein [Chryseobacterium joostei]AZB01464.1 hypothetical protein EG359_18445 [Chryseobacterium joostei]SIS42318.1 hypothetical protein SAMN05421768_10758 [Chryseobacterium joostei]
MKKIFYFLLGVFLLSCSGSNDDVVDDMVLEHALQPEKAYVNYFEDPFSYIMSSSYYQFTYKDNNLMQISEFSGSYLTSKISLSYSNTQIKVSSDSYGSDYLLYSVSNNKPLKLDCYLNGKLYYTQYYIYEQGMIKVLKEFAEWYDKELTTYYFDIEHNLTKSEVVKISYGVEKSLDTYIYSNFDKAQNPYKSLWMLDNLRFINLDDNLIFAKSLSFNNFKRIEHTFKDLVKDQNSYTETHEYNYKYDSNGQVLLYHPL